MTLWQAIILAIVEGISEFLPISSTGHMIIASTIMGIQSNQFVKTFTVAIQFGAILSVVVLYFKRFFQSFDFYFKLFVAVLPAIAMGLLFKKQIDALLENVVIVGITLLIGGIILLFVDKYFAKNEKNNEEEKTITYKQAFFVGIFQVIAMVPGVSRSASTIIGGLFQGLNRKRAAEFSFFLAIPTMFGATCLELKDNYQLVFDNLSLFLIGNLVAFIVALLAIRSFISYLTKYGFQFFGYYRIALGLVILSLYAMGYSLNLVG